jgi:hypothetical protein
MTKPIAERFNDFCQDDQLHDRGIPITGLWYISQWLQAQAENKQPLFTLEQVEAIAKNAWTQGTNDVGWADLTCRRIDNTPNNMWNKMERQLLEKQGKK